MQRNQQLSKFALHSEIRYYFFDAQINFLKKKKNATNTDAVYLLQNLYSISVFYLMTSEHVWCFLLALSFMYLCFEILPLHKYICCFFFFGKISATTQNPSSKALSITQKKPSNKIWKYSKQTFAGIGINKSLQRLPLTPQAVETCSYYRPCKTNSCWCYLTLSTSCNKS